jgi:hypothetical protein
VSSLGTSLRFLAGVRNESFLSCHSYESTMGLRQYVRPVSLQPFRIAVKLLVRQPVALGPGGCGHFFNREIGVVHRNFSMIQAG